MHAITHLFEPFVALEIQVVIHSGRCRLPILLADYHNRINDGNIHRHPCSTVQCDQKLPRLPLPVVVNIRQLHHRRHAFVLAQQLRLLRRGARRASSSCRRRARRRLRAQRGRGITRGGVHRRVVDAVGVGVRGDLGEDGDGGVGVLLVGHWVVWKLGAVKGTQAGLILPRSTATN